MANKPLKSIKFPGLSDTYTVPEVDDTLATTGAAADAKKVGDEISDLKAEIDDLNIVSLNNRKLIHGHMSNAGTWNNTGDTSNYAHIVIPVKSGMVLNCAFNRSAILAFVKSYTKAVNGEAIDFSSQSGFTEKVNGLGGRYVVPSDVNYIIFEIYENGSFIVTSLFNLDGYNLDVSAFENMGKTFMYHGDMSDLGLTTFQDCNKRGDGFYRFSQSYVSSIADKPSDLTTGGVIIYVSNYAGGSTYRRIIAEKKDYYQIGNGEWTKLLDTDAEYTYRGDMSNLSYTTFAQCSKNGYYNFSQSYLASITDKPDGITTGGIIKVYTHFAGGVVFRILFDSSGNQWIRLNVASWKKIVDANQSYAYKGDMSTLGYTSFIQCNLDGYYNFGKSYLSSIEDAPTDLNSGGIVEVYTHFASGVAFRVLHDDSGNEWIRLNVANWKKTIDTQTMSDTVWYAFGDSITRGLSSYIEDDEAKLIMTSLNYVYWVSQRNGYKVTNYGQGASGYLHKGEFGTNGKEVVDDIDFSNCNLVTFAWGVNDWHYNQNIGSLSDDKNLGTTMASNMKYCIEKVLTDNPLCKLIIMLPMNCSKYGGTFESDWGLGTSLTTSGTLQHVIDTIREIAEYYHLQIIDQSDTSVVNRFNINECLPDGIHPSVDTYKQIGLNLAKQIQFA